MGETIRHKETGSRSEVVLVEKREKRQGKGKVKASNQAAEGQKTKESLEGGCSLKAPKAPKAPKALAWMEAVCPTVLVLASL